MDLLWFDETAAAAQLSTAKHFRGADVVMLRGDWHDLDTTYLGVKGGTNDACEHGHYDLGSFVLDAKKQRWAIDLGPDDYNLPGYFTPKMRSRYYRTSTIGHNTIVIDGECQAPTAGAAIVRTSFDDEISFVVMDLSMAYPATISALRGFALINRRDVLIVDEITPQQGPLSVDWQMHTRARFEISAASAALIGSDSQATPFYLRIIDPSASTWSVSSAAQVMPPEQSSNYGVAKLVVRLDGVVRPVRLAVLLSPSPGTVDTLELPSTLRRPLSEWGRPSRERPRRARR
jgi:Heparinase II/III-like protein